MIKGNMEMVRDIFKCAGKRQCSECSLQEICSEYKKENKNRTICNLAVMVMYPADIKQWELDIENLEIIEKYIQMNNISILK